MAYATTADVQARFTAFTLSASTKPTLAQVTQWLVEADAKINVALVASGLSAPAAGTNLAEVFKTAAVDFATGLLRQALAAAGGDGSNDDGKDLVSGFYAMLADLRANPSVYGSVGSSPRVRGHATSSTIDLDDTSKALAPVFTKESLGDQF